MEKEPCYYCDGSGIVYSEDDDGDESSRECPYCDGTGNAEDAE